MMKTVSQAGASVCLHRRLRTFGERPNMRKKPFCARFTRKTSGIRMVGAMRERPWRGAARSLFIHVCERETMATSIKKETGKRNRQKYPSRLFPHYQICLISPYIAAINKNIIEYRPAARSCRFYRNNTGSCLFIRDDHRVLPLYPG